MFLSEFINRTHHQAIFLQQCQTVTGTFLTSKNKVTSFQKEQKTRAVKVSVLIYAINVAAINAIKYFNAVSATLFTSGVRCPDTKPPRANVASALHRRHGASSLICNFIKVNTNMSHFLFLTLTLQQPPRLLHSPSSFTTDAPTNQPMRACYPTQPHPIGLELSHVPPRPVQWPPGHLSTYLITL